MSLRVRRADAAPGIGPVEYFARTPASVITDRDLSDGAARQYDAIRLWMVENQNPKLCLATMKDLAALTGVTEREARRRVTELERRGHVVRERVRSISGSPQGIRPLAELRPPRTDPSTRTKRSDCNRTDPSGGPDHSDGAPGPNGPPNRTKPSAPLKREGEKGPELQTVAGSIGERPGDARPTAAPKQQQSPEEIREAWKALGFDLEAIGARKKAPGSSAKTTPGPESRNSVPDAKDCTREPAQVSSRENHLEHKND